MGHEESIELLPWLVNGSLTASEREAVQTHAESCIVCRRELAELEALQESIQAPAFVVPAPDMRRINARIDAQLERESRGQNVIAALREFFASPWRAAFAAQTLALVVVATLWLQADTNEPQPRTRPVLQPDARRRAGRGERADRARRTHFALRRCSYGGGSCRGERCPAE